VFAPDRATKVGFNGNNCYHWAMNRQLSRTQIEVVCIELVSTRPEVSVRDVTRELKRRHGAAGRNERVAGILKGVKADASKVVIVSRPAVRADEWDTPIAKALERAERAEDRERRHQDFWADRYAQRCEELELHYRRQFDELNRQHSERYLGVCQRVVELERRIAGYEAMDPASAAPLSSVGAARDGAD